MEPYIVSARKYRPGTFGSMVGQEALTATLRNAIATDRLAHAYLFTGSRGIGKTSCARIFAKTINCTNRTPEGEACNECASCRDFNSGASLNVLELDAASNNSVDDIRSLTDQVVVPPVNGKYKVFIIDEVHMLSTQAFNAFLKTLEEPPAHVIFILATTEKHKIIPTILSRCQIYDFTRISISDIVKHLGMVAANEGITAEPAALHLIARKADGALRDALSIFDQVAASSRGNITYAAAVDNLNVLDHAYYSRLLKAFLNKDVPSALLIYKEIRDKGFDSQFFINGLGQYLRDIMVASSPSTATLLETADDVRAEMQQLAAGCAPAFLYRAMDICNDADLNYRQAANKQFFIEVALIKLCQQLSPSPASGSGEGLTLKPLTPSSPPLPSAPFSAPSLAPPPVPPAPPAASDLTPKAAGAKAVKDKDLSPTDSRIVITESRRPAVPRSAGVFRMPDISGRKPGENKAMNTSRAEEFSDADLENACNEYIAANPMMKLLAVTLATCKPQRVKDAHYKVLVDNIAAETEFSKDLPHLLGFLRKRLGNDNLVITTEISEGLLKAAAMSEKEAFENMLNSSEAIRSFIETLQLTLQ